MVGIFLSFSHFSRMLGHPNEVASSWSRQRKMLLYAIQKEWMKFAAKRSGGGHWHLEISFNWCTCLYCKSPPFPPLLFFLLKAARVLYFPTLGTTQYSDNHYAMAFLQKPDAFFLLVMSLKFVLLWLGKGFLEIYKGLLKIMQVLQSWSSSLTQILMKGTTQLLLFPCGCQYSLENNSSQDYYWVAAGLVLQPLQWLLARVNFPSFLHCWRRKW